MGEGEGRRMYRHRKLALFVGPWREDEMDRLYHAIEAVESALDTGSPDGSEALLENNRRRLPRRWLCAVYRLQMTQDYYTALRYDFDQALVSHRLNGLAKDVRTWAENQAT